MRPSLHLMSLLALSFAWVQCSAPAASSLKDAADEELWPEVSIKPVVDENDSETGAYYAFTGDFAIPLQCDSFNDARALFGMPPLASEDTYNTVYESDLPGFQRLAGLKLSCTRLARDAWAIDKLYPGVNGYYARLKQNLEEAQQVFAYVRADCQDIIDASGMTAFAESQSMEFDAPTAEELAGQRLVRISCGLIPEPAGFWQVYHKKSVIPGSAGKKGLVLKGGKLLFPVLKLNGVSSVDLVASEDFQEVRDLYRDRFRLEAPFKGGETIRELSGSDSSILRKNSLPFLDLCVGPDCGPNPPEHKYVSPQGSLAVVDSQELLSETSYEADETFGKELLRWNFAKNLPSLVIDREQATFVDVLRLKKVRPSLVFAKERERFLQAAPPAETRLVSDSRVHPGECRLDLQADRTLESMITQVCAPGFDTLRVRVDSAVPMKTLWRFNRRTYPSLQHIFIQGLNRKNSGLLLNPACLATNTCPKDEAGIINAIEVSGGIRLTVENLVLAVEAEAVAGKTFRAFVIREGDLILNQVTLGFADRPLQFGIMAQYGSRIYAHGLDVFAVQFGIETQGALFLVGNTKDELLANHIIASNGTAIDASGTQAMAFVKDSLLVAKSFGLALHPGAQGAIAWSRISSDAGGTGLNAAALFTESAGLYARFIDVTGFPFAYYVYPAEEAAANSLIVTAFNRLCVKPNQIAGGDPLAATFQPKLNLITASPECNRYPDKKPEPEGGATP